MVGVGLNSIQSGAKCRAWSLKRWILWWHAYGVGDIAVMPSPWPHMKVGIKQLLELIALLFELIALLSILLYTSNNFLLTS